MINNNNQHFQNSMDPKSLTYKAYRQLEEMIITLKFKPGEIIREIDLCQLLGIGRTPVKDAIKRLADDSLVTVIARRGALVAKIDIKQQMYVVEFRRSLEELLSSYAARRRTLDEAEKIRVLGERMENAISSNDVAAYLSADREYKKTICVAARNPYLARAIDSLHSISRRFWYVKFQETGEMGSTVRKQLEIVNAIVDGDESAAIKASNAYMDQVGETTRLSMELD